MIPDLPVHISIAFLLTTLLTLFLLYLALAKSSTHGKKAPLIALGFLVWLGIQSGIALSGFYSADTMSLPPRIFLSFVPPLLLITGLFATKKGRAYIDSLPLLQMTWVHVVRIPVEIVLYWLFLAKAVPELMTFAGRNFDILAGITAPIIAILGVSKGKIGRTGLLVWNFVALGLLMFIVVNALLSGPTPLQQFAFDQPNIAIFYFPLNLLPGFVVPAVLFSHFASIRQLLRMGE